MLVLVLVLVLVLKLVLILVLVLVLLVLCGCGSLQVVAKLWDHFRAFGGIDRCVVQQTGVKTVAGTDGGPPVCTAHAIVTMKSLQSYERAIAHHQLQTDQKGVKVRGLLLLHAL